MKEQVYRFIGAVLLTIIALLGVGAGLHVLMTLPFEGKGAEWVGAIGTVGTLIGTIILARQETVRRRRQERDAAVVAAAFMDLQFIDYLAILRKVLDGLSLPVEDDFENPWEQYAADLRRCPRWTREEIQPLIYFGSHVAADLAVAQEYVRAAAEMLDECGRRKYELDIELWELSDSNIEIAETLEEAHRRVENAWTSCSDLLEETRVV